MLTKKYIVQAAELIKATPYEERWPAIRVLTEMFARSNPRFGILRFFHDCGVEEWDRDILAMPDGRDWFFRMESLVHGSGETG